MKFRRLGRTGLEVSSIAFGALPLGGLNAAEAKLVLNSALDLGVNFIDTARGYRTSEELIGMSLQHRRKDFLLATKTRARSEEKIREELSLSLKSLRTDCLDLYQIHYVNTEEELEEVFGKGGALDALKKLRDEGKTGFIGITGHSSRVLLKAAQTLEFDTVQAAFSYVEREQPVFDLISFCAENDIGFIAQKPLAGGALTTAGPALRWILQHPVSTAIPGMVSREQVLQNTSAAEGPYGLSAEEQFEIGSVVQGFEKDFCRRCYYCHPVCPENIRIGVILEFLGKAQFPENLRLSRKWYQGYAINAVNCTECGLCLPECPYNLPIVEMLKKAHALLG